MLKTGQEAAGKLMGKFVHAVSFLIPWKVIVMALSWKEARSVDNIVCLVRRVAQMSTKYGTISEGHSTMVSANDVTHLRCGGLMNIVSLAPVKADVWHCSGL